MEANVVSKDPGEVVLELCMVNPEAITWDGMDEAIIGTASRGPGQPDVAVCTIGNGASR